MEGRVGAPRGATVPGRVKGPASGLSQQAGEAEGSPNAETRGRVEASLTTTGRAGTARRCGSGKRDGTPYERNQCLTPRNPSTGSNLADLGRDAAHAADGGDFKPIPSVGEEATGNVCGVGVAMLPG